MCSICWGVLYFYFSPYCKYNADDLYNLLTDENQSALNFLLAGIYYLQWKQAKREGGVFVDLEFWNVS